MESRKHHRRKSQPSIRSPLVKRDLQSQVTMEGWLYKLEGGALKQWKRRWFVLSDFCLFYYKGPEEEKILGSILLPSYKINPCTSDDKTSRKFAFKAEHHNMKTYYFAADSPEVMKDWMNAMSLASIMQKVTRHEMMDAKATFNSAPNDDEDSGFTSYRSRRYGVQDPNSTLDSSFASEHLFYHGDSFSDGIADMAFLGSDDKYPSNYGGSPNRSYVTSPHRVDGPPRRQPLYANAPPKPKRLGQSDPYTISPSEQYGSSVYGYTENVIQGYQSEDPSHLPISNQYTDSLGQYVLYPDQNIPGHRINNQTLYVDKHLSGHHYHEQDCSTEHSLLHSHLSRKSSKQQPPRPHSADFLERETEYNSTFQNSEESSHQPPRPKSSMECYDPQQYWTQEEWSGDDSHCQQNEVPQFSYSVMPDHINSASPSTIDRRYLQHRFPISSSNLGVHGQPDSRYYSRKPESSPVRHSASATHIKEMYWPNKADWPQNHIHWEPRKPNLRHSEGHSLQERRRPVSEGYSIGESLQMPNGISDSKKAQLREESLKRLLEWKQRMLQSPLTKKAAQKSAPGSRNSSPSTPPVRPPLPEEYRQKVLQELESHEARLRNHELEMRGSYGIPETTVNHNLAESSINCEMQLPCDVYIKNSPIEQEIRGQQMYKRYSKHDFTEPTSEDERILRNHVKDDSQKSVRSPTRSQEMRRSSSSLNRMNQSYSSDDEESLPSQPNSGRRGHRNQFKDGLEDSNMSDSEIHVREPCRLRKLVQQSEGLTFRGKRLSISAGDLLGKTHEELVLLLIQLRRNQSRINKAKEKCCLQLEKEQQQATLNPDNKQEHLQNINELEHQITEMERQFETTQPLVSLVDNMVKLGSLYGGGGERRSASFSKLNISVPRIPDVSHLPKQEFIQAPHSLPRERHQNVDIASWSSEEERNLQECLRQLCHLDRSLHEESLTFCCLLQDKHMLEQTLCGVRNKIHDYQDNPVDVQKLKKQQRMIEKELSRVTRLLSHSAQKMEETAAENAKFEQEVLVLRQKIQEALNISSLHKESSSQSRSELEAELSCVQKVIEELADHRREISRAVEKLKLESSQKLPSVMTEVRASPTGVVGSAPLPLRKKHQSSYLETDLDTMETHDLSTASYGSPFDIPLYVNAEEINTVSSEEKGQIDSLPPLIPLNSDDGMDSSNQYLPQDINEADDRMKRFYGILPREKPSEIKTVRIVKRESERRNRVKDKKKVTYDDQSLVWVVEEPEFSVDDAGEEDENITNFKRTMSLPLTNINSSALLPLTSSSGRPPGQSAHERLFGSSSQYREGSRDLSNSSPEDISNSRRSKRRHYTISGFQTSQDHKMLKGGLRSRDDLDMEHCLRTANTPDIVRSTIKKSEIYDEKIIDRELNLPQKIVIPERYIEDEPEQLTATERLRRSLKAETIRKMLSQTTTFEDIADKDGGPSNTLKKKLDEEKRRRAHLLALNHTLAKEVMEKSKIVAASLNSPDHS